MKKRSILKEASVLLVAMIMILTAFMATADTNERTEQEAAVALDIGAASQNSQKLSSLTNLANFGGRDLLWDNGDTDGTNGLSHATQNPFGSRRSILDDFEIPTGETWTITDFHSYNLWDTLQPGSGSDFILYFWSDNGGSPGAEIAAATTVSYTETATGRTWFSRPEFEITYEFEPIVLTEGTYWIRGHVDGPENCFWMARETLWGSECWVDYEDYPPLQPGSGVFGTPYDVSYQLTGTGGGQPEVPDLDCDGTLGWEGLNYGETATGTFTVENIGDPGSELDWEIQSYPDWGIWNFDPDGGLDLTPEDGVITVEVEVVAPEEGSEFTGEVVLVNSEDPDDICIIDATMKNAVSQQSLILEFLEILAGRFPLIAQILAAIL